MTEKRRKQSARKGGGQTVVSYEYFATFAVALARGPVDAIRRVWADGKLLVDLSENAQQGKTSRYGERIYRFHPGTENDQAPDALIEMHETRAGLPRARLHRLRRAAAQGLRHPRPKIAEVVRPRARSIRTSASTCSRRASTTGARRSGGSIPDRPFIYNFWGGWLHTSEPDARGSHRFARLSPLPCLAPDIVEAILDRRQPEADEAGRDAGERADGLGCAGVRLASTQQHHRVRKPGHLRARQRALGTESALRARWLRRLGLGSRPILNYRSHWTGCTWCRPGR